ncbi:MAG: AAA family ATPase [Candidatus Woesearchaeota archaeon]
MSDDGVGRASFSFTSPTGANDIEYENRMLKETVTQLRTEIDRLRTPALMIAEVVEQVGSNAIIQVPNGNKFYVEMSANVEALRPGESVLLEQKNLTIIDKIRNTGKHNAERFLIIENPKESWKDIGGLEDQIRELREVVELPLLKPKLFEKVGISPPKGVLLHGPPGTGKTLLAKAVASSTHSTFIEIVGSELVQKFIGEGARLVKEIFELAREKAPSIVFIDEIDALAARRVDMGTSGEREVQRTFMQLLAEIDGFKPLSNVKIIGCTNRMDILDPAIMRPGRLDRLIEVPAPTGKGVQQVFNIHSKNMHTEFGLKKDALVADMNGLTGAEIKAICTEAGYFAIRDRRTKVKHADFVSAVRKVRRIDENSEFPSMYG